MTLIDSLIKSFLRTLVWVLLAASLVANGALLFSAAGSVFIFGLADSFVGLLSRLAPVQLPNTLNKKNYELTTENERLKKSSSSLRQNNANLTNEKRDLTRKHRNLKGNVKTKTNRIVRRTLRVSGVNLGGMALEAAPFVGVSAIVGLTTYEIVEGCNTINDMRELNNLLEPDDRAEVDESLVERICDPDKIPTWGELAENWIGKEPEDVDKVIAELVRKSKRDKNEELGEKDTEVNLTIERPDGWVEKWKRWWSADAWWNSWWRG